MGGNQGMLLNNWIGSSVVPCRSGCWDSLLSRVHVPNPSDLFQYSGVSNVFPEIFRQFNNAP